MTAEKSPLFSAVVFFAIFYSVRTHFNLIFCPFGFFSGNDSEIFRFFCNFAV